MISYRLKNGKEGNLTDPAVLRVFYARIYFYENKHEKNSRQRSSTPNPRRSQARGVEAR
jgi:hypothetical protein